MNSRNELLQRMPIFGGLRGETLDFILSRSAGATRRAGQFYFLEGDPGNSLFVLEAGRVAVLKRWKDAQRVLRVLGKGDCFGEMAIIDLLPRSAAVRAEEDCVAIEITAADLYRLYKRNPEQFALIQMNMARELSRRLRAVDEILFRAEVEGVPPAAITGAHFT